MTRVSREPRSTPPLDCMMKLTARSEFWRLVSSVPTNSGLACAVGEAVGRSKGVVTCSAANQRINLTVRSVTVLKPKLWHRLPCLVAIEYCCSCVSGMEELRMSEDSHSHHEIDYIEFGVTDMAQSRRFYAAAFDWQFTDYGPGYAGIRKRQGGEAGGLRLQSEVAAGGPLVILYSVNLEQTLARVRDAGGGRITQEIFEFVGGRRFHFRDQ